MEWKDYVSELLSSSKDFNNLTISLDDGYHKMDIPPLIKASILMLDKMLDNQGQLNLFVLPERFQSFFIFFLMKVYHNILMGKIQSNYDPMGFSIGEKIKVGNAVVEYLGLEQRDGKLCFNIKLADVCKRSIPIEILPIFQKTDTNRGLSKDAKYDIEKRKAMSAFGIGKSINENLAFVADMKTHVDSSVFVMTPIAPTKIQLAKSKLNNQKITDVFFVAQSDYKGDISHVSPGQMKGTPAIVLASDLYSINAAAEKKLPIQSIIIDASNMNTLSNQFDILDDLIKLNKPILCIADVSNSLELESLSLRGFNIWRWDYENCLAEQLYGIQSFGANIKTYNCAHHSIAYLKAEKDSIDEVVERLASHRNEINEQSPKMMKLFEILNRLAFLVLRTILPMAGNDFKQAQDELMNCSNILVNEANYLDDKVIDDYTKVIALLKNIYSKEYILKKIEILKEYINKCRFDNILLVVHEKYSKEQIQNYWSNWCLMHNLDTRITVLYPSEYYNSSPVKSAITIVCGWFKYSLMRKIIYSYITDSYTVIIHNCENIWKEYGIYKSKSVFSYANNREIIKKSFSADISSISGLDYEEQEIQPVSQNCLDELEEIEKTIRENKYRQFESGRTSNVVTAIPVSFVGGAIAFYRIGHEIITATKIIMDGEEDIELKLPTNLQVGNFIVIRDTDKDLVRDMADSILAKNGIDNIREIAAKWREALQIELLFCTEKELCEKIKEAGCNKGLMAIKRWIDDENVIAPQTKEDLHYIALATENETLLEMLDSVFYAAQEVRSAHIYAGKKISEQLKISLAEELQHLNVIDPFNFWVPIEIEIEGVGKAKVLKVIDVGNEIQIDSGLSNRLLEDY